MGDADGDVATANGTVHDNADTNKGTKVNKTEKKKARKKKQKIEKQQRRLQNDGKKSNASENSALKEQLGEDVIVEYVSAPIDLDALRSEPKEDPETDGPSFGGLGLGGLAYPSIFDKPKHDPVDDFKRVLEVFAPLEELTADRENDEDEDGGDEAEEREKVEHKPTTADSDSDEEEDDGKKKLSKKKQKLLNRLKIAELKQICERPDVVEVWDVTAPDPQLLVFLKAYRNSVPVPRHWSQKRKYLQGKRGIEKPAFKLPDFIEATGISEMRKAYQEKEEAKKLKQKQRERMQPKMGRMDIDYQVLHDAFFKHQTKPQLTGMGELYYEGKEFEARVENVKPGVLSEELRKALGMSDSAPPPWLINMQRYGPPPSYPNLKIPGLNAPIPPGATFGYHPGGWGKPPVDEDGNPLYGDVFGQYEDQVDSDEEIDKSTRWGELEPEIEESSEEEEESEEEAEGLTDQELADGMASGIMSGISSGIVSGLASGIASSLPSGIETPEMINLRKATEAVGSEQRSLYTVLEQKQVSVGANTLMGSDHVYVVPPTGGADIRKPTKKGFDALKQPGDVEVTISPEELEGLDEDALKQLYNERMQEMRSANKREDFSDMVAAKAMQQKRKLAAKQDSKSKKAKDFKF